MNPVEIKTAEKQDSSWPDARLVRECLDGSERAWSVLIDKYKNLIFSIPIKYGFSRDVAADIFQGVCLDLLTELPKLREPRALPKWLIQVTSHKCYHWRRSNSRTVASDSENLVRSPEGMPARAEELLHEVEQEQILRQALTELPPRCRELVHMLFFENPPRAYREVAQALRIATGSIGFIRQRCLDRLRRQLIKMGFQ